MEDRDKWITCVNCGKAFVFSVRDQKYYGEQGFKNEPKRCRECRALLKRQRQFTSDETGGEKELFRAVCEACGRATYVPFKPTGVRPIYCKDCLVAKKIKGSGIEAQAPMDGADAAPPPM
jgi:CxxC-x17-CxxC domain-containing protein